MKKTFLLLAVSIVCLIALVGCSDSSDSEAESKASNESLKGQSIVVYTGRNLELVEPLVEQFEKETGINVELRDGESAELATQILTEGDASKADIFLSQDAGALGLLEKEELLEKLPDELTAKVQDRFKSANDTWVGTSGRARVLVYNPDQVSELPETLDDLVSPEYKGRIGYAPTNASFQSFVTALRVTLGEEAAEQWLVDFAENEPKVYEKNGAIVAAVNDGEIDFGLVNHYYLYELIAEKGAKNVVAKNHFFQDDSAGSLVNAAGLGILKTSEKEEAAQKFVEYLIGEKGQKYFVEETSEYPVTNEVASLEDLPELSTLGDPDFDLSDLDSLDETIALLDKVGLITS